VEEEGCFATIANSEDVADVSTHLPVSRMLDELRDPAKLENFGSGFTHYQNFLERRQ